MRLACLVPILFACLVLADCNSNDTWAGRCACNIRAVSITPNNRTLIFVDSHNHQVTNVSNAIGVTYDTCLAQCNDIGPVVGVSTFISSLNSWLLPWLALAAQLPYETSGWFDNLMSILLALGSPVLATYSLVLTILNHSTITDVFKRLNRDSNHILRQWDWIIMVLGAAEYLLKESQQAPMRAIDSEGWLRNLLSLENNKKWWEDTRKRLRDTRRGVTQSLALQLVFAIFAWICTVYLAIAHPGDTSTGLAISTSSCWLWMVPVIVGWVAVGTQSRFESIHDAVDREAYRRPQTHVDPTGALDPTTQPGMQVNGPTESALIEECQKGIISRPGYVVIANNPAAPLIGSQLNQNGTAAASPVGNQASGSIGLHPLSQTNANGQGSSTSGSINQGSQINLLGDNDRLHLVFDMPSRWTFSLNGDEGKEGPIFNYARIFTWYRFSQIIWDRLDLVIRQARNTTNASPIDQLLTDYDSCASYMSFRRTPEVPQIPSIIYRHMIVASLCALFVQWGTTGPSIMIAYLTPARGLGCNSGGYLLYAVAATLSWLLLGTSSLLSHAVMLRVQSERTTTAEASEGHLAVLCVITRIAGYLLACLNALFLVANSIAELSGATDGCWCNGDALSFHAHGWVMLFESDASLAKSARPLWIGGVVFIGLVCILSVGVIVMSVRDKRED